MSSRPNPIASTLSHAAVFAAIYVGAAVVCFVQLSGMARVDDSRTIEAVLFAVMTAMAVYLLDRVKVRDAWLDPADNDAQPDRQRFLAGTPGRARVSRLAAVALAFVAALIGTRVTPLAPEFVLLAIAGGVVYAGRPRCRPERSRVKDRLIIKNAFVALGIAGFAGFLVQPPESVAAAMFLAVSGPWLVAAIQVSVRVFADASLCDLDDESADRRHDTSTLATRLGRFPAWSVAMALRFAAAGALVFVPIGPQSERWAWAIVTFVSTIALRVWSPRRLRDAVDLRFAVEAGAVVLLVRSGWL